MQNLKKLTDEQLVAAYIAGNNTAFDILLSRNQNRLFGYILHIVHNKDLADDIFQETFIKAITKLRNGNYTETGKFSAWLNRIAHNLIIDYYRQEKAENTVSADDENTQLLNRLDIADDNIEDLMIDEQIGMDLRNLVASLPEAQREVLIMRFYRNLSFKEIAEITGVSINTSLGRMRYALINLRRIVAENDIVLTR